MRGKRLPCRQCCACGTHRGVDIFRRSLRHTGEPLARGRISGLEVAVFGGRLKGPVDEMSEAPLMAIEPGQRLFRILWRGAVFHSDEFFSDAHVAVLILERGPLSSLRDSLIRKCYPGLPPWAALLRRFAADSADKAVTQSDADNPPSTARSRGARADVQCHSKGCWLRDETVLLSSTACPVLLSSEIAIRWIASPCGS